jgi:ribonuclease HI
VGVPERPDLARRRKDEYNFLMPDTDGSPAPNEIVLYADGSFSCEVGVGAWAFTASALNLEGVGSSEGTTVTRFEFLAVLHGLEAVAAVDKSGLPVHVISDCDSTVAAVKRLAARLPLKNPAKYQDRADLIPRLKAVLAERPVQVTRYSGGRLEHKACHRNARRKLREEVNKNPNKNPMVRHHVTLTRLQFLLSGLTAERGTVLRRLEKLDEEISLAQLDIAAVELAMRKLTLAAVPDQVP